MSQATRSWGLARPLLRTRGMIASPITPPPMNASFIPLAPLAEDGAADAHDRRSLLHRHREVVRHPHRELAQTERFAHFAQAAEYRSRRLRIGDQRGDGH